jgi:ferredoxin
MNKQLGVFQVVVEDHKCVGAGQCVVVAPEVFDQRDEDGMVVLLQAQPDPALRPAVEKAARLCPALAIRIEDR